MVTPAVCVTCWLCLASLLPLCHSKNQTKTKSHLLIGEKTGLRNPARCESVNTVLPPPALNTKAGINGDLGVSPLVVHHRSVHLALQKERNGLASSVPQLSWTLSPLRGQGQDAGD